MTWERNAFDNPAKAFLAGGPEWIKALVEAPAKTYATLSRESLAMMARSIQAQADYLEKLSKCKDPAEMLSCQSEYAQKGFSRCVENSQHLFDIVRSNCTPPAAPK